MASQALLEAAERTKADEDNEAIAVRRGDRRRTAAKSGDMAVADVCRQMRISEAIFHVWKKKYAYLGSTDLGELRQLCEEKAKLRRLVVDLSFDKHLLAEFVRRKICGRRANANSSSGCGVLSGSLSRACLLASILRSLQAHRSRHLGR